MMYWIDIASIVFVCVTMNHLGLVKAIEEKVEHELPILNCPKCSTMWCTLVCSLWHVGFSDLPVVLAISFLASYAAIWLELLEGYIDTLYLKLYDKIYNSSSDTSSSDSEQGYSAGSVS
jgi:hypothetical protein